MINPPPKTQRRRKSRNSITENRRNRTNDDESRKSLLSKKEKNENLNRETTINKLNRSGLINTNTENSYENKQNKGESTFDLLGIDGLQKSYELNQGNKKENLIEPTHIDSFDNFFENGDNKSNSNPFLDSEEDDNSCDSDDSEYVRNFLRQVMVTKTPREFKKRAREIAEAKAREKKQEEKAQEKTKKDSFLQIVEERGNLEVPNQRKQSHSVYKQRDKAFSTSSPCPKSPSDNASIGSGSFVEDDCDGFYDKCFDELASSSFGIALSPKSLNKDCEYDTLQTPQQPTQKQNRRVSTGDLRRKSNDDNMFLSNTPYHQQHHKHVNEQGFTKNQLSPAFGPQNIQTLQEHPQLKLKDDTVIKKERVNILEILKRGMPVLKYGRQGYPHFRHFQISKDNSKIVQFTKGKRVSTTCVHLATVNELVLGQKTNNFKRYPNLRLSPRSFSLLYENRSKTLDLVCKTLVDFEMQSKALKVLIENQSKSFSATGADNIVEIIIEPTITPAEELKMIRRRAFSKNVPDKGSTLSVQLALMTRLENRREYLLERYEKLKTLIEREYKISSSMTMRLEQIGKTISEIQNMISKEDMAVARHLLCDVDIEIDAFKHKLGAIFM